MHCHIETILLTLARSINLILRLNSIIRWETEPTAIAQSWSRSSTSMKNCRKKKIRPSSKTHTSRTIYSRRTTTCWWASNKHSVYNRFRALTSCIVTTETPIQCPRWWTEIGQGTSTSSRMSTSALISSSTSDRTKNTRTGPTQDTSAISSMMRRSRHQIAGHSI